MSVAIITGASRGLGRAISFALAARGWSLVVDARGTEALNLAVQELAPADVVAVPGDIADAAHRADLVAAAERLGRLQLVVNNASALGPSPQPALSEYPVDVLARVYAVNLLGPLALIQTALPRLREEAGAVVNVSSDAAVETYPGWGGYGSSKAALDHLTATLAVEEPALSFYSFDPGDMRTDLHQQAFPGEDISDRPAPETVAPALLSLLEQRPPSGRYRASELQTGAVAR